MSAVQVSNRNAVLFQVATALMYLMVSGRLMMIETNMWYRVVALIVFIFSLGKSALMLLYAQWRSMRGWSTEVELPNERD